MNSIYFSSLTPPQTSLHIKTNRGEAKEREEVRVREEEARAKEEEKAAKEGREKGRVGNK